MATFVNELVNTLAIRWREVDVLLETAKGEEGKSDAHLHDVLCRASVVLIVAHLEGFVRDCARAVLKDINHFSTFQGSPGHLKWTFCSTFIHTKEGGGHNQVKKLITLLDGLQTKFAPEPFLFEGKHDDSRNPSPAVIEKIAKNFGIKGFFALMASSRADVVFTNVNSDVTNLTNELYSHLLNHTVTFPYTVDVRHFGLDVAGDIVKDSRTLWEAFLDNLLTKRHEIAHGSDRLNSMSIGEIRTAKAKAIILQYAFAIMLCKYSV